MEAPEGKWASSDTARYIAIGGLASIAIVAVVLMKTLNISFDDLEKVWIGK